MPADIQTARECVNALQFVDGQMRRVQQCGTWQGYLNEEAPPGWDAPMGLPGEIGVMAQWVLDDGTRTGEWKWIDVEPLAGGIGDWGVLLPFAAAFAFPLVAEAVAGSAAAGEAAAAGWVSGESLPAGAILETSAAAPLTEIPVDNFDWQDAFSQFQTSQYSPGELEAGWDAQAVAYDVSPPIEQGLMPQPSVSPTAPVLPQAVAPQPAWVSGEALPTGSTWSGAGVSMSVQDALRSLSDTMRQAVGTVAAAKQLQTIINSPRAVVGGQSRVVRPDGTVLTRDQSGRAIVSRTGTGIGEVATDGSVIINNGDGTYTRVSPDGRTQTLRYGQAGTGALSLSTAGISGAMPLLLIGGALLFFAMRRR